MKRNMKQWIEMQIAADVKTPMPILSFPSISLLNISVPELISDSEMQAEGMHMIAERVDSGAALSMMDLSVEAEAFGSEIRFSDDEVPTVIGSIIQTIEDAEALKVPEVGSKRTGIYIEAIGKAARKITDRPVFAGVIGPFSLAGRLMDVSQVMMNCIIEPEFVHTTMRKTTDFLIEYIKAYRDIGANGVVIAEPLTGLLSPDLAEGFSEPYVREIIEAVQTDEFICIYHNCGNNTVHMASSIMRVGASGYHFGNAINMAEILPYVPAGCLGMGNVDPAAQFRNGTPEQIRENTMKILDECARDYPNFIISSGCDIPPMTPWGNIDAFFEAVANWYE